MRVFYAQCHGFERIWMGILSHQSNCCCREYRPQQRQGSHIIFFARDDVFGGAAKAGGVLRLQALHRR